MKNPCCQILENWNLKPYFEVIRFYLNVFNRIRTHAIDTHYHLSLSLIMSLKSDNRKRISEYGDQLINNYVDAIKPEDYMNNIKSFLSS